MTMTKREVELHSLKTALAEASEENKKERKRTEKEYRLRAKLLERVEGCYGSDDGFCNLRTKTLMAMVENIDRDLFERLVGVNG